MVKMSCIFQHLLHHAVTCKSVLSYSYRGLCVFRFGPSIWALQAASSSIKLRYTCAKCMRRYLLPVYFPASFTWWPMAEKERSFMMGVSCYQTQEVCVCVCRGRGETEQSYNQSSQQPSPGCHCTSSAGNDVTWPWKTEAQLSVRWERRDEMRWLGKKLCFGTTDQAFPLTCQFLEVKLTSPGK